MFENFSHQKERCKIWEAYKVKGLCSCVGSWSWFCEHVFEASFEFQIQCKQILDEGLNVKLDDSILNLLRLPQGFSAFEVSYSMFFQDISLSRIMKIENCRDFFELLAIVCQWGIFHSLKRKRRGEKRCQR